MVDKNNYINLRYNLLIGDFTNKETINLLYTYFIENSDSNMSFEEFWNRLAVKPQYIQLFVNETLTFFDQKFNVTLLKDKNGRLLKIY